ncbi:MAG: hypothetical protein WDM79_04755 [Terricaulis sp.]
MLNFGMFAQLFSQFSAAAGGQVAAQPDGAQIVLGMMAFSFRYSIFLVFFYVLLAAYEAACLRWMIHGEVVGFLGLSLGAPTWRVYSTYWLWAGINFGISTVVSLVTMPFLFFGMAGASGGISDPTVMGGTIVIFQIVVSLLQYIALAIVGVRFGPAAATSITLRKFSFFTAWTVTKGTVLGAVWFVRFDRGDLFARLCALVHRYGRLVFAQAWPSIASGASAEEVMTLIAGMMTPQTLALLAGIYVVMAFVGMIFYVMFYGVNARAVLAAIEDGKIPGVTPELANTFS